MGGAERGRRKGGEAKQSRVVERSEIGGGARDQRVVLKLYSILR